MHPDARRYAAALRLYTRTIPTVLAGALIVATGYLTYQSPEAWRATLELWAGLLFVGACLGGTELFARFGLGWLGLARHEVSRTTEDSERLSLAIKGLGDGGRPFYPALIELGQAPVLLAAHGGRLYVSTHALRNLEPPRLRLLLLQALEKLSFPVLLERILITAVLWWIPALTLLRSPLGWVLTLTGALALVLAQLILQEWLYHREQHEADLRVLELAGRDQLAPAIADLLALTGPGARTVAVARIMALGVSEAEAQGIVSLSFHG